MDDKLDICNIKRSIQEHEEDKSRKTVTTPIIKALRGRGDVWIFLIKN
jgi:hypothetical protein